MSFDPNKTNDLSASRVKDAVDLFNMCQYVNIPIVIDADDVARNTGQSAGAVIKQLERMREENPNLNVFASKNSKLLRAVEIAATPFAEKRKADAIKKEAAAAKKEDEEGEKDDKNVDGKKAKGDKSSKAKTGKSKKKLKIEHEEHKPVDSDGDGDGGVVGSNAEPEVHDEAVYAEA